MNYEPWSRGDDRALPILMEWELAVRQRAEEALSRAGQCHALADEHQRAADALHAEAQQLAAAAEDVQENGYPDIAAIFRERSLTKAENALIEDEVARAHRRDAEQHEAIMEEAIELALGRTRPSGAAALHERAHLNKSQVAGVTKAVAALEFLGKVVSPRIDQEEIGDALEVIHKMAKDQRPAWAIYAKVARTIFWVCVHTAVEKFVGVVKMAMGQGDDRQ